MKKPLMILLFIGLLAGLHLCTTQTASAHAVGENYVWLNVDDEHLEGRFELNLNDMESVLGISTAEANGDPAKIREVLRESMPDVEAYLKSHFHVFANDEEVDYSLVQSKLFNAEGSYAQYYFKTDAFRIPNQLIVENTTFLDSDSLHRGLLLMEFNKKSGETYGEVFITKIFSNSKSRHALDLLNIEQALTPLDFIWQGILHIWIGIDHILFLIVLLIPAVLKREDGKWIPVGNFRGAMSNILKIVTIFTVAHSITLSLAALQIIQLPSALVESVIALSILLVGLNVLYPVVKDGTYYIIFALGLFHGLGFASVMGELPFRMVDLLKVVLMFNVGVEIGQLVIVLIAFPMLYLLSRTKIYQPVVLRLGTICLCVVASYWFYERAIGF